MNKSTVIAVVVFAALAAAAIVTLREKPERGITRVSFADLDPAKIDRVVVKGPNPIELTKDGDQWKADGKRADPVMIKSLLDGVAYVESSEVVTRNHDRFADLGVDDEKGAHVQVFSAGRTLADFVIGDAAAGGANLRVGDSVYMVKRVSKATFARPQSQWLDRKLFADTINDTTRVEVRLAGQAPYVLIKDGEAWRLADESVLPPGFRFDRNAARSLVSALLAAQAKDLLDDDPGAATTGLGDGADTLAFEVASGDTRMLQIGGKHDADTTYAHASTRPELVSLADYVAKNLRKAAVDLRDLSLMSFDPSSAKRLEIVKENGRLVFERDRDTWKIVQATPPAPADFTFDSQAVTRRLAAIGAARAVAEADETGGKTAVDKPMRKVDVTLADDRVVTLAFGADTQWEGSAAVYARGNADANTYLVRPFTRDNLLGGVETFAQRPATSPLDNLDPRALSNLPPEVRESLLKQLAEKKQRDALLKTLIDRQGKQ